MKDIILNISVRTLDRQIPYENKEYSVYLISNVVFINLFPTIIRHLISQNRRKIKTKKINLKQTVMKRAELILKILNKVNKTKDITYFNKLTNLTDSQLENEYKKCLNQSF